jgi:hypothetical protein
VVINIFRVLLGLGKQAGSLHVLCNVQRVVRPAGPLRRRRRSAPAPTPAWIAVTHFPASPPYPGQPEIPYPSEIVLNR